MKKSKELKIGCGWWGFRNLPIEDHFAIASDFGFHTLEIGIGDELVSTIPTTIDESGIQRIRELCDTYDMNIPFATIESDFTLQAQSEHEKQVHTVLKDIAVAAKLGVTHLRIFAGFTPVVDLNEEIYRRVLSAFEVCAAECQQYDMEISIETHGRIDHRNGVAYHTDTISTHPYWLKRLSGDLPKGVGFNYDPGNIKAVYPDNPTSGLESINSRINYCHLKDWKRKDDGWLAAAIGDDDLDYQALLPKIEFDGIYLIEYEPVGDLRDGIRRSLDYLERIGYHLDYV
ncbi:sugar phosphate isomerase/epimerase family protein [Membranihabitans maritimus]|uniref:sugar phosphate isomerase/epimerase family protein n=1 Tax=Membranihabitans maritimus TaxID=2904244 RepID=UPI001F350E5E|nr:sugar phosphate isomerase/epimerase family protein [Membranihabitans maritimus]